MKVYLSPSTQEKNIGKGNYGTEEKVMNEICDILEKRLKKHGFTIKRNKPTMTLNQVIADSNAWKPDIHVALHSNAGGGIGLEIWIFKKGSKAEKLAKALYGHLSPLTPWADRGIKESGNSLGETSKTTAPAVIVEIDFHDNLKVANWILENKKNIAEGYLKGICDYAGVKYVAESKPAASTPSQPKDNIAEKGKFFRVQLGAFSSENNAKNFQRELKTKHGLDTIIKYY